VEKIEPRGILLYHIAVIHQEASMQYKFINKSAGNLHINALKQVIPMGGFILADEGTPQFTEMINLFSLGHVSMQPLPPAIPLAPVPSAPPAPLPKASLGKKSSDVSTPVK
jgi:hypothetical protein